MKKLPGLFKKSYTKKQLDKKILKKIYVPEDKKYVSSLFVETGKKGKKQIPVFSVNPETKFNKKEYARLKQLNKQIKKQKGRIKLVPLVAVVSFIFIITSLFLATKNIVLKKGLQVICETIFQAKTDIGYVNFSLLDSSIKIKKIDIADKSEPMKNLISFDEISLDFDLTELLKAKFVADNLAVLGIDTGTPRTISGELTESQKKRQKKVLDKVARTDDAKESELMKAFESRTTASKSALQTSVTNMFATYNPQAIINSCYTELQLPEVTKNVESTIKPMLENWQNKPAEIGEKVKTTSDSIQSLINYDFTQIQNNPVKIKEVLEQLNNAVINSKSLSDETTKLLADIKTDSENIQTLSVELQSAIKHDTNYAKNQISKITSFKLSDGMTFISDLLDPAFSALLGKYYPYAKIGIDKLMEMKSSSQASSKSENVKEKSKKVKTKNATGRLNGRNISYKKDRIPKLWIKNIQSTGVYFNAQIENISSDQDKLGKPTEGSFSVLIKNINHNSKFILDIRSESENPLVTLNYNAKNFPFAITSDVFGEAPGTPTLNASLDIDCTGKIFNSENFVLDGNGKFNRLTIKAEPFEPAYAYKIYSNVLGNITSMNANASAGFSTEKGIDLKITSDADKKFANALTSEMNNQLNAIKKSAQTEITKKIEELSKNSLVDIKAFNEILSLLKDYNNDSQNFNKKLEAKRKEAEKYLQKQMEDATSNALKNMAENAGLKTGETENTNNESIKEGAEALNKIGNKLKKLF